MRSSLRGSLLSWQAEKAAEIVQNEPSEQAAKELLLQEKTLKEQKDAEFKALWPVRKGSKQRPKSKESARNSVLSGLGSPLGSPSSTSRPSTSGTQTGSRKSKRGSLSMSARLSITAAYEEQMSNSQQQDTRKYTPINDWRSEATAHQSRRQEALRQRTEDERWKAQQETMELEEQINKRRSLRSSIAKPSSQPHEYLEAKDTSHYQIDHTDGINSMFPASKLLSNANPSVANGSAPQQNDANTKRFSVQSMVPNDKKGAIVHRRTVHGSGFAGGKRFSSMDELESFRSRLSLRGSRTSSIEADPGHQDPSMIHRRGSKQLLSRRQSKEDDLDESQSKVEIILELARKHGLAVGILQEAYKEFEKYDRDCSGQLSTSQFHEQLKLKLNLKEGQDIPQHIMNKAWEDADQDGNGAISFEEFLLWRQRHDFSEAFVLDDPRQVHMREIARDHGLPIADVEDIVKIFDRFDEDRSGTIEKKEFKKLFMVLLKGKSLSDMPDKRIDRYWNEIDLDQSGKVTLDEFVLWYMKYFYVDEPNNDDPCRVVTQAYASLAVNRFRPVSNFLD